MKRILVTGAFGFVGRHFVSRLRAEAGRPDLLLCARRPDRYALAPLRPGLPNPDTSIGLAHSAMGSTEADPDGGVTVVRSPELNAEADWGPLLRDVSHIVHLAGIAHTFGVGSDLYRRVNVEGTLRLAREAAARGVRRFVFVSTIKVHGEGGDTPYTEADPVAPADDYAHSKWSAEQGLHEIADRTGMQIVILRPPLIYGPGVGGNLVRLMHAIKRGWPLPFASVDNRRSLLYVGNFADIMARCLDHPGVVNQSWVVSDGSDYSTPELVRVLARAMNAPARLFPLPPALMRGMASVLGARGRIDRLLQSLMVDGSRLALLLDWNPVFCSADAIGATVEYFMNADHEMRSQN